MRWDLTGERVNGLYMGLFPYAGVVTESRVKYGGDVQYTVKVDESFKVYGATRDVILVSITEINRVLDRVDAEFAGSFYDTAGMSYEDVRRIGRE